ncbi:hypothetical protein IV203_021963 [Nitzschia inconspicua]|uniref:SWIM-type domain-containing protein n=1 Tax=Nitzschia inconspicua TaxID=303405 RepID=A0A9K3KHU3_9STRA|nr:hypothetical protein IV203_021963 [Nitzschia inconspicua]
MAAGQKISNGMLRDLVRPLYPPGTSLDSKLLFNIRLKIKRMLAKGDIDLASYTVTADENAELLSAAEDLNYQQSPEFLTEALIQFQELLKEAFVDQNEVQQILHYLDKLVECDSSFSYRVGRAADGTVTGFVWQTGVMRRDFELYGDILFLDCKGKSINTKGWPIDTIAMLDGEMKVCLPCEGFSVSETIDGYVWLINCAVDMAPGRKLSEIKFIVADGIFTAENVLSKLEIQDTCRVILDHHYLLCEDIGAWPKAFGLDLFSHLREDLTTMVKSSDQAQYHKALESVRSKLRHHLYHEYANYLETNIHSKRHLFANHIIKTYPGLLDVQGNAPVKADHSSIVTSISSLAVEPVTLIQSIMSRHIDISSERDHFIAVHHLQCLARAYRSADEGMKEALKGLTSWGFMFYEKAAKHSKKLCHSRNPDGSHSFAYSDGSYLLPLPAGAEECSCPVWVATGGTTQCSHLLLAQGGFSKEKWSIRWHQREALGASCNKGASGEQQQRQNSPPQEDDDVSMQDGGCADGEESVASLEESLQAANRQLRITASSTAEHLSMKNAFCLPHVPLATAASSQNSIAVNDKGEQRSWVRVFNKPELAFLHLLDNCIDAAVKAGFHGKVAVQSQGASVVSISNNSQTPIKRMEDVQWNNNAHNDDENENVIGGNDIGLVQACASLSEFTILLTRNYSTVEMGIIAKELPIAHDVCLPALTFNVQDPCDFSEYVIKWLEKHHEITTALCNAFGAAKDAVAQQVAQFANSLFQDQWKDEDHVCLVVLCKLDVSHVMTESTSPAMTFLQDIQAMLPKYYINLPSQGAFDFMVDNKRVEFTHWQKRLVELTKFEVYIPMEQPFEKLPESCWDKPSPDKHKLSIYCGFDAQRLNQDLQLNRESSPCHLYIHSCQRGRLIKKEEDVRQMLGLSSYQVDFAQGLTVIVNDTSGNLPLTPTKDDIAWSKRENGEIHQRNFLCWTGAVRFFFGTTTRIASAEKARIM